MLDGTAAATGRRWLEQLEERHLGERLTSGSAKARSSGETVVVSATFKCGPVDAGAVIARARRPDEAWFVLEQPDRDGSAIAGLGCARALEASGPRRFAELVADWRAVSAAAILDEVDGPPASGLIALGGFAFAAEGGYSPAWNGFAAASLQVPEVSIARRGPEARLTLNFAVAPDDTVDELASRARRMLERLRPAASMPLIDPSPTGSYNVVSSMPPSHYEQAVARAVERIRAGELEKVVLAREVQVHAPAPHDPAAVIGLLREEFPSCYVFAVGRGDATFLAASPELLVRREGKRASTVALAGSTRRSADPSVDAHLGEQLLQSDKDREENAIVARRIAAALRPHSVWVTASPEPVVVQVANIQHLATPIRAQLAAPLEAIELAGLLHPTPAVGGEPWRVAEPLIPSLEGLDRGWYAGPVGWTDATGDGEFCVALRCALLRGAVAHLYAGGGIVRDSDPAAELAETEVKLGALLPVLAG